MAGDPSAVETTFEEPITTSDGRIPGRRGRQTREGLLDSTAALLAVTSYRDLKVVDIARHAGTSPATFYQYFSDVEEAVLLLAERVVDDTGRLLEPLEEGDWSARGANDSALALADAFLEFWDGHEAILRVMNLAIVEGDQRFRAVRDRILGPVTRALAARIAQERRDGADPIADAAALVSMLVHVAEHHPRLHDWGVDVDDLRASMSRIVAGGVAA